MEFTDSIPVAFKEVTPNHHVPEKWKEIILNTGGIHSTLQDIKLPQRAGGYWYKNSKKVHVRNRFIYWQTTLDSIELCEASFDLNLSGSNLRCKVAAGTPPLGGITVYERCASQQVIILAATISSVHRLIFPYPKDIDRKAGSLIPKTPSILQDVSSLNNPNNYFVLNQYSNPNTGVAHTCATLLRDNGEAIFALAFGHSSEGGLLLVKLPVSGQAVTLVLKKESTVPRFLSGITGALRGKNDGIETYDVDICNSWVVAICGDACLRAWSLDEGGSPHATSLPLTQTTLRPKPPPHGHMIKKSKGLDGGIVLVVHLSFPDECEFVVLKMQDNGAALKFAHICRIFGPQLDLLDYVIGYGDGNHVIWALWSQPDGEEIITSSTLGAEASWQAVAGRSPATALPQLSSHQQYQERLFSPPIAPPQTIRKALAIYQRTWGGNELVGDGDLGDAAVNAVQAKLRHLAARATSPDHSLLMHKCWAELYSWCMQYMEGLQKPIGLMVSTHNWDEDSGWWCGVIRRAGISLVRELSPLDKLMRQWDSPIDTLLGRGAGPLSPAAVRVVVAGARWEAWGGAACSALERRLFLCAAPQHRLLPRLAHLLRPQHQDPPMLTTQQIDELTAILEPIKDLQNAVLELNDALRLDVPDIDTTNNEDEDTSEYETLFASDLGIALVTEAIKQMADLRCRVVRGALAALGVALPAGGVPGAGHCAVHWQAYRALLWLHTQLAPPSGGGLAESFRLKLSALGLEAGGGRVDGGKLSQFAGAASGREGGVMPQYASGAGGRGEGSVLAQYASGVGSVLAQYAGSTGGRRARRQLARARAAPLAHNALPLMAYHIAHQLWAVSGGFEFGWWLASINQPRLVQNYVNMLEPWCEWNACSRQFILGLSLLDLKDPENAYTAFCKAAKGVSTEPFLRQLIAAPDARLTQHQALVLYYMKVIKLFEIHEAGACVVRLAETAISIADKDDPNLAMFQWLVFKWHLSGGRVERALSAAAANPEPHARAAAAANLLTTLASRKQLGALVSCSALAEETERAAAARAKLHDADGHNPYYDFLYALHLSTHHYRKAAAVMYERASRCYGSGAARRRWLAAALTCLRLARPQHAFLARRSQRGEAIQIIGPEELAAELRDEDPNSLDPVKQALLRSENIDFDLLYPQLKDANAETLLNVTKRAISTGQFLPHWFMMRFMEVDAWGCTRALLSGGRAAAAGACCCRCLRRALAAPHATPHAAPLALADRLLLELRHAGNDPDSVEIRDELEQLVHEYTQVVVRRSEDMKLNLVNTMSVH